MSFDSWSVDVYINDGEEVDFRVPITASNMDITGKVSGHYAIEFIGGVCYNRGDVTVDDAVLSVGMYPLPDWWVSEMAVAVDMNITLRKNVQAIYPLGSAPILRANLADNQTFRFVMEPTGELYTDGELMIRSGEFYYFQKNFYITSGSVNLRDGSSGVMDPVVSLRARLRTFDSEGEKVDIYLVLQDATLDNISPVFESSPSKDLNEIMSILGQAIISTGDNTNLVGNVVSLAATSVDFLSRMGIINTRFGSIDSSVKSGLSLDTFSLHTNILANVLTDTVTLWDTSIDNNLSPMARYLDGTTLYMGKYLTPEWYFQVMLHLAAERSINDKSSGFSFIADDLILDTEISIEWNAPICTITFFTQPLNLTAYSIFENYGISFTRRIIF